MCLYLPESLGSGHMEGPRVVDPRGVGTDGWGRVVANPPC